MWHEVLGLVVGMLVLTATARGMAQPPASDVLAAEYSLPEGFASLSASVEPVTERWRIDGVFEAHGTRLRVTTVRGSKPPVAEPGEPEYPIDVCIRNARTGEVLIYVAGGDERMIRDCRRRPSESGDPERDYRAVADGLETLRTVRFTLEFEPEYEAILGAARTARAAEKWQPPSGDGVIYEGPRN
jgi:hypothetical protein